MAEGAHSVLGYVLCVLCARTRVRVFLRLLCECRAHLLRDLGLGFEGCGEVFRLSVDARNQ